MKINFKAFVSQVSSCSSSSYVGTLRFSHSIAPRETQSSVLL